jgi:hypothetical protein
VEGAYFLHVAVATHSHGAPGIFRWLQSQFTLVMLKKPLAMQRGVSLARGETVWAAGGLQAPEFALSCNALVFFVRALDPVFKFSPVVRELLDHFVSTARHIATGGPEVHHLTDVEFVWGHGAPSMVRPSSIDRRFFNLYFDGAADDEGMRALAQTLNSALAH